MKTNGVPGCVPQAPGTRHSSSSEKGPGEVTEGHQPPADCVLSPRARGLALEPEFFVVSIPLTLNSFH